MATRVVTSEASGFRTRLGLTGLEESERLARTFSRASLRFSRAVFALSPERVDFFFDAAREVFLEGRDLANLESSFHSY